MKVLLIVILVGMSAGCASGPVDLTDAYWDGGTNLQPKAGINWPNWNMAPAKGVRLGERSFPPADKMEFVHFLWDETGIYGYMFGFWFRRIEISRTNPAGRQHKVIIGSVSDTVRAGTESVRHSLGPIAAWREGDGPKKVFISDIQFRHVDHGWISKPGQCGAEFRLSWTAIGSDGPPSETVTIRVAGKLLILPPGRKKHLMKPGDKQ